MLYGIWDPLFIFDIQKLLNYSMYKHQRDTLTLHVIFRQYFLAVFLKKMEGHIYHYIKRGIELGLGYYSY